MTQYELKSVDDEEEDEELEEGDDKEEPEDEDNEEEGLSFSPSVGSRLMGSFTSTTL